MEEIKRATPAAAGHGPWVSDQLDGSINPEFTVRHAPAQAGDPVIVVIGGAAVAKGPPTADRRRDHAGREADLNNHVKSVLDAINAIVVRDDAQITELRARKRFGEQPKLVATIRCSDENL